METLKNATSAPNLIQQTYQRVSEKQKWMVSGRGRQITSNCLPISHTETHAFYPVHC